MITIVKPQVADAEAIHNVIKESWYATYLNERVGVTKEDIDLIYADNPRAQLATLQDRILNPKEGDVLLAAKDGKRVAGFIRFKIHPDFVELRTMYVLPDHFGQGVGTQLWSESLKLLPPGKSVVVEVATYTKAKEFYKKIGFVQIGEEFAGEKMLSSRVRMPLVKMVFER